MTTNKTIQVQDRVLPAGTYVFKLLDSQSNRHVVQIFNEDQSHIIDTIMAMPNYRLRPTGHSRFIFYETPPGAAPALRAWFYPGDNFGQEFRYPKHLAMLQTVEKTEATRMNQQAEESKATEMRQEEQSVESSNQTAERQETEAAPAPVEQETLPAEQPTEIAQNTPPPAPAAPAAEPQPAPAQTPRQLPKTASPFPLFGLGGLLSLGLYGMLRLKRLA